MPHFHQGPVTEVDDVPATIEDIPVTLDGDRPRQESAAHTIADPHRSAPQRIAEGAELGEYLLERRVGAGGMGEVFAARKRDASSLVALKVLSELHATRLYRFKREFRALANVKHDNLIALDELVVLAGGQAFFTMELVDGVDFVEYVRGDTPVNHLPNLVRLERALHQLVSGVRHLHLSRCVHRDLKPSNVLVTREGRVVILDFGVVSELAEPDEGLTRDGQMMGTPAYMAPEQAGSGPTGPAADFYALGIMLFECLTGVLPFSGSVLDILIDKRHSDPPDPRAHLDSKVTRSEQASELIELCHAAMAVDPHARPGAKEFLAALGDVTDASPAPAFSLGDPRHDAHATFVGRHAELAILDDAYATVRATVAPVAVHIRGNSGQGKSTLVNRFLSDIRDAGEVVILRGRCLERESVPYKGVDSVVDALSIYVRRLDELQAARLQPRHLAPLLQLFPVLGDAWPGGARVMDLDPGELRRRGFAGLREVLARVGERRPLVVYIDDFQWADVDSARLLTELMRPPDPPAMLLVITFRDEVAERDVLQLLTAAEAVEGRDVREIEIGPLSKAEAQALASALMRDRSGEVVAASAEAYARRAQGNPFYIGQMVLGDDTHSSTDVSLDRLVARRIVGLEPAERRVLATVAVAGGPTPAAIVLEASETPDPGAIERLVAINLIRRHGEADGDELIESAHDRIRVVAVGELSPVELRATHLALGEALERRGGGEAEALAEHFNLGGDELRALEYTEQAAADAAAALAFERAAQLYRRALGLVRDQPSGDQVERKRALELALAEQLVDLGRGAEAAEMFLNLAERSPAPKLARDLRRRAASELVKAGYLDEGMDTITPVLRELGIWQPRRATTAIVGTIWNRVLLLLRGYAFTKRADSEVGSDLLERIDTLLATKTGLSHNEAIFAGYQQSRAIRLALRAGEPRRLIRCLVHDASIFVAIGKHDKGFALMQTARELVAGVVEPEFHRVIEYVSANHLDHIGRWPEAAASFEQLHARLDESPNSGWIRGASTVQLMYVRKLLGRFALLRAELPERLATARDLGIRHELVSLSCLAAMVMAIYGELEPGRRLLEDARTRWHPRQITFQHIIIAMTEVEIAMLAGEPQAAVAAAERVLGNLRAKIVATMMPSHVDFYELRGRSRVSAALGGHDVERSLQLVRHDLTKMRRGHKPQVAAQALAIEAALHCCERDKAAAEARWREAAAAFEALAMQGHLAAVRTRLAELGDEQAGELARAYFAEQGIDEPARLVDALAPGQPASGSSTIAKQSPTISIA